MPSDRGQGAPSDHDQRRALSRVAPELCRVRAALPASRRRGSTLRVVRARGKRLALPRGAARQRHGDGQSARSPRLPRHRRGTRQRIQCFATSVTTTMRNALRVASRQRGRIPSRGVRPSALEDADRAGPAAIRRCAESAGAAGGARPPRRRRARGVPAAVPGSLSGPAPLPPPLLPKSGQFTCQTKAVNSLANNTTDRVSSASRTRAQ
jgi:hypothetical protein